MIRFYADHIATDTNVEHRVEIHDATFGGSAQKMKGVGPGWLSFSHQKLDPKNPLENPIQKGSLKVTLWVRNAAERSLLDDVLSATDTRFTLKYVVDSVTEWEGLLLPDLTTFTEDTPSKVTFVAKDFSYLEGVDYDLVTVSTLRRLSVIIAECLQETGLTLPIRSYTNVTNDDITDQSQDFLYALYHQKFALRNKDSAISCLEVLEYICRAYNLIVYQSGNRWIIEQLPAVAKGDAVQFDYDENGLNPVSSTPSRSVVPEAITRESVNEVSGALKSITSRYKHRTLILNIGVEDVTLNTSIDPRGTFSYDFDNDGDYHVQVSADVEAEISGSFDVLVGTAYYQVRGIRPGESTLYLNSSGNFTQTETDLEVSLYGEDGNTISGSFSIQSGEIPLAVSTIVIDFGWADIVSDDLSVDDVTFSNTNAYLFNVDKRDWQATILYKYTRSGNYSVTEEVGETLLGDGPISGNNQASRGRPFFDDFLGDYIYPGNFKIRGEATALTLEELRLRERMSMRRNPLRVLSARMIANASREDLVSYGGSTWYIIGDTIDGYTGRHNAYILLLDYQREVGDVFQVIVEEGGDPSGASEGTTPSAGSGISLEQADSRYLQIANDLSDVDAALARANLGLGSLATQNTISNADWSGADLEIAHGGTGASSASAARVNLGLEIGSDIQAHSPILDGLADNLTATAAELNRLDGDLATVRGNLGLGTTDDVQFRDITVRDMEIGGVINYRHENNLYVEDKTITLNRGGTNASSESAGLIIERPGGNQSLLWSSTDGFEFSDSIKASGASFGGDVYLRDNSYLYWNNVGGDARFRANYDGGSGGLEWDFLRADTEEWEQVLRFPQRHLPDSSNFIFRKPVSIGTSSLGSETLRVAGSSLLEGAVTATGALSADTLRPDTGKFLSPVSYQFRNAGDSDFRDVQMAGLQATTGAFTELLTVHDDILPNQTFHSNIGSLSKQFLSGYIAELYVPKLVVEEHLSTTGGVFYTGIATVLAEDITAGATSIKTQNNNLSSGDYIRLYARGQFEIMKVTSGASGSGPYTYSISRNIDGSGANSWNAGDGIFNTGGVAGFGFIEQYAVNSLTTGVSTAGPSLTYQVRTGTGASDIEVRGAQGNLKGWYDYSSDIFGAAFGDPSGAWVGIDPTNGFRLMSENTALSVLSGDTLSMGGDQGLVVKKGERTRIGTDVDIYGNLAVSSLPRVSDEGLVALWRFDGDGLNAISGNSGTFSSSVFTKGVAQEAFKLDGTNYFSHSEGQGLDGTTKSFSVSIYAKIDSVGGLENAGGDSTGDLSRLIQIQSSTSYRVRFWNTAGTGTDWTVSGTEDLFGKTHHFVLVYDGSTVRCYRNAVKELDESYSETLRSYTNTWVGRYAYGGSGEYMSGWVDEYRIYEREIDRDSGGNADLSEIKSLYLYPSGNSGGLISANTVQTGQLISTNYAPGSGSFTDAGTLIDLDTGNIRSEQFSIINGNAAFAGNIDGATFTGGSATLNTYLQAGNVEIGRDVTNALDGDAHNADGLYINDNNYWYGDGEKKFGGASKYVQWDGTNILLEAGNASIGASSGWFGASDILSYSASSVTAAGWDLGTQAIEKVDGNIGVYVASDAQRISPTNHAAEPVFSILNTDTNLMVNMGNIYRSPTRTGFALFSNFNTDDKVFEVSRDNTTGDLLAQMRNLTIAGALTMGDTGSILLPSRGIIEGQNSLNDPLWRLEWRGLHLDTSAELEWFSDHALGVNSKSVAFIQASGDGGTSATNNQLVLRTAGSNSSILMTTGILDINASVHFTGGALRGAEFFNDATFQNAAIFEPMVINSSTPPSTGWKVGTSSVTGDLVAVHSSGTFRVLASN